MRLNWRIETDCWTTEFRWHKNGGLMNMFGCMGNAAYRSWIKYFFEMNGFFLNSMKFFFLKKMNFFWFWKLVFLKIIKFDTFIWWSECSEIILRVFLRIIIAVHINCMLGWLKSLVSRNYFFYSLFYDISRNLNPSSDWLIVFLFCRLRIVRIWLIPLLFYIFITLFVLFNIINRSFFSSMFYFLFNFKIRVTSFMSSWINYWFLMKMN